MLVRLSQPTPVAAALVHAVVEELLRCGCDQVIVAGAVSTADRDRGFTDLGQLARMAGLPGHTDSGMPYDLIDLWDSTVPAEVPPGSVLAGGAVSAAWVEADTRVVVGRSTTDIFDGYLGCLSTLIGVAPEIPGARPADVVAAILEHAPPGLALVDATVSSDGPDGARLLREHDTNTVIAATDAVLADAVLATLQGEDRSASPLVEHALRVRGHVMDRVEGDLARFENWHGVSPIVRAAACRAASHPRAGRVVAAAIGEPDIGSAPVDRVLTAVRSVLTPLVQASGEPAGRAPLVQVLSGLAGAIDQVRAWTGVAAKGHVERVVVPLGFDPAAYEDATYDELPAFLAPFERLLEGLRPNADGMRWCLVDGATVFAVEREIAVGFDEFVDRVDVAAGISLMADYLGGRRVTLSTTSDGRGERQAERNLYLPQPNYLAFWGGKPIDVCKIELVQRDAHAHRLYWRTVASLNGSATFDDGVLAFTDLGAGRIRVAVRGRQLFTLPDAWAGFDVTSMPELRDPLLEEAYRRFFTVTFDNLEACFEGRDATIGVAPPDGEVLLTGMVDLLLDLAGSWLTDRAGDTGAVGDGGGELDRHGFRHVRGDG
ncbi:DUF362 domain-containing protein [Microlunatus aurantiacus]|uniref:DUF362 domain-containing protein n=1 Tax=Microlunatus aurantiacus TaxID=446786 RepID=UPI0031DF5D23